MNGLFDIWPQIKDIPFKAKDVRIDIAKYPLCSRDDDIHFAFTYLKYISTHRVSFENAIKSFIVYSDVRNFA